MLEDALESIVMFFGLTNSLVTFQAIINDLLRDIIEAGDVLAFIDDIIVWIEIEKEHDNIVKEVLKRMVKNNSFVKTEKCIWKVREVDFLEVIIRPDRIKIKFKRE